MLLCFLILSELLFSFQKMDVFRYFAGVLLVALLAVVYSEVPKAPPSQELLLERSSVVDVILMGCAGDLARRYLWSAVAQLSHQVDLRVVGAGRQPHLNMDQVQLMALGPALSNWSSYLSCVGRWCPKRHVPIGFLMTSLRMALRRSCITPVDPRQLFSSCAVSRRLCCDPMRICGCSICRCRRRCTTPPTRWIATHCRQPGILVSESPNRKQAAISCDLLSATAARRD